MGLLADVGENRLDEVRRRLEDNPDEISLLDTNGNTPLHLAAEKGYTEMVKLLVDFGADLESYIKDFLFCFEKFKFTFPFSECFQQ